MRADGPDALVLTASVVALLLAVLGAVGLLRWRRRNADLVERQTSRLTAVSRTLRRGGTVPDGDRTVGVLVVEQLSLVSLPLVGTLVLSVAQVVRAVARPDDSTAVLLVLFLVAALAAIGVLALCARAVAVARRQGIRPGRLW